MKKSILVTFLFAAIFAALSCSGGLGGLVDNIPVPASQPDQEQVDAAFETLCSASNVCDTAELCVFVCDKFDFTQCVSELIPSLPFGKYPKGDRCIDRCSAVINTYMTMAPPPDLVCIGKANTCSAVAACLKE